MPLDEIRNFCITAHIDHGKSTLADRILEICKAVSPREIREQYLDSNAIERERGITIKAKAVCLAFPHEGKILQYNLIDTPGHVDFSYEVSRSLAACEGAILLVDATQGVQAQTVANAYLAIGAGLDIIPVLNKIDSPMAQINESIEEMHTILGIKPEEVLQVSAKTGINVLDLLGVVSRRIRPPAGKPEGPLRALIFDSVYDEYRGVIVYVRVIDGRLVPGMQLCMLGTGKTYQVEELGKFRPKMVQTKEVNTGEVGYVIAGIRDIHDVRVGDTLAPRECPNITALPGYIEPLPVVFCGFYPTNQSDYKRLGTALARLGLNDSSFHWEAETSEALGFGYRCGFLGLLHMEIVEERLEREEEVEVIRTAPNVTYEVVVIDGEGRKTIRIDNPAELPEENLLLEIREPMVRINMIVPSTSVGGMMKLCEDRRGNTVKTEYISPTRVMLTYDLPFAEVIYDFYDKMKSVTRGYGTLDYQILGYFAADLVQLRILIGGLEVDALSAIVHRDTAERKGRKIIAVLRKEIPRHMFEIPLQAAMGKRIVARETIRAMAKNVTAKCYGGDISRKRKLLEKQKEGKKKMKSVGRVDIPQKAFMAVLAPDED